MDTITVLVGALAGVAGGVLIGVPAGRWCARRSDWIFWSIGVLIFAAGTAVAFYGLQQDADLAFVGGVAFIAAGLTALKYAARKVPGVGGPV